MSRSTLQTTSAPSDLICPLSGKVLVDPVRIGLYADRTGVIYGINIGPYAHRQFHFEKACIEQILQTTGILPIINIPITRAHLRAPEPEFLKGLQEFHAAVQAAHAEQAALQAILAATPQLVPVYQPVEVLRRSLNTVSSASQVTATVKNPTKKEEGFLATFVGLFGSEKSTQPTATATTQAPSQQATATVIATTSPLATTRTDGRDRILLSIREKREKSPLLQLGFP